MKNNTLYEVNKQNDADQLFKKGSVYGFWLLVGLMASQQGHAQFYNIGDVKVETNTILSVHEDYDNTDRGIFTNDGLVYILKDWKNDGTVDFTRAGSNGKEVSNGTTYFVGKGGQIIEGKLPLPNFPVVNDFQNIVFSDTVVEKNRLPFYLATEITINKKAEFASGIVNAVDLDGLVIFNENADHRKTKTDPSTFKNVSNISFVDGKVQKKGIAEFQFPVGSGKYFRPSEHKAGNENSIYTTQYFYKNSDSDGQHSHEQKESTILEINDQEYWEVKQNQGSEKIVLSLTLDHYTTPSQFFDKKPGTKLAIVRWDETQNIWVNEKGELSKDIDDEAYSNLLTSQVNGVSGYGLFTMALVKDTGTIDDDGLIVYNAVSPNGDGLNDTFHIAGLNKFPDNTVEIYNRWGVKVYDAKGYNESDVMFAGYSDGRATINRGEKLPTGTYFYILKYNNGTKVKEKAGYLYINNQ